MIHIAEDSGAGMVYADRYQVKEGKQTNAPVIDYQFGSLRDDFDFGSVLLFRTDAFKEAAARMNEDKYKFAGLYDLRLKVSQNESLVHINEYLYSEIEDDTRKSGEKIFDYVDPRNRDRQIEMEQACTEHLKEIGGYLAPEFKQIEFSAGNFEYEASVIIPVRNRIRTIRDAIHSVLKQKTDFKFNLIIIDNHSTDGTTEAIDEFKNDERLIHIIPERNDLGIGGCWNMGVHHPKCGKFAVQLDSDDVYSSNLSITLAIRGIGTRYPNMPSNVKMIRQFCPGSFKSKIAHNIAIITKGTLALSHNERILVNEIKDSDIVVHAPGGPSIGDLYYDDEPSYLSIFDLIISMNKKYMFYAPSMGPFKDEKRNMWRKKILCKAKTIDDRIFFRMVSSFIYINLQYLVPPGACTTISESFLSHLQVFFHYVMMLTSLFVIIAILCAIFYIWKDSRSKIGVSYFDITRHIRISCSNPSYC